jgi:hypothetical protein
LQVGQLDFVLPGSAPLPSQRVVAGKFNFFFNAKDGLFKIEGQVVLQIAAAPRRIARLASAAPPETKTEQLFEDVAQIHIGEVGHAAHIDAGVPIAVIRAAFLVIAQHRVGFVELFEFFLGIGGFVYIGVILAR